MPHIAPSAGAEPRALSLLSKCTTGMNWTTACLMFNSLKGTQRSGYNAKLAAYKFHDNLFDPQKFIASLGYDLWFLIMCMCGSDPLELGTQEVVTCPIWTELRSSAKALYALNPWGISPTSTWDFSFKMNLNLLSGGKSGFKIQHLKLINLKY